VSQQKLWTPLFNMRGEPGCKQTREKKEVVRGIEEKNGNIKVKEDIFIIKDTLNQSVL